MINPDQLSPEQIQSIRTWAEEGLDLNAIQKRLHEDLNIKLTFMDTKIPSSGSGYPASTSRSRNPKPSSPESFPEQCLPLPPCWEKPR